jgi:hypothetical protein
VKDYPAPRPLPSKAKADDTVSINSDEIMSWRGVRSESTVCICLLVMSALRLFSILE